MFIKLDRKKLVCLLFLLIFVVVINYDFGKESEIRVPAQTEEVIVTRYKTNAIDQLGNSGKVPKGDKINVQKAVDQPDDGGKVLNGDKINVKKVFDQLANSWKDLKGDKISVKKAVDQLANSGKVWKGDPFRTFSTSDVKFRGKTIKRQGLSFQNPICKYWGVLTTVFKPSEAARQFLYLNKWCLVVIGDRVSNPEYTLFSARSDRIIYVPYEDQIRLDSKFINSIPAQNYGRKNIGFMYAVLHGATAIWDFDDDNMLKFWIEGASVDDNVWFETFVKINEKKITFSKVKKNEGELFFNPYPYLGGPTSKCWPRGFPISKVMSSSNFSAQFEEKKIAMENVAVLQSLADHQPDVDGVYRMIEKTPFYFNGNDARVKKPILLSHGVFSPMNAQATIHYRKGFFALYLPVTVHGRVTDIWRSYIAQTLFSLCELFVGFLPKALVDQNRNPHSYLADFQAELPLYSQTDALVEFLDQWRLSKLMNREHRRRSMEDLMEELYISLFERGYIEKLDVINIQLWLKIIAPMLPKPEEMNDDLLPDTIKWVNEQTSENNIGSISNTNCGRFESDKGSVVFSSNDFIDTCRQSTPLIMSYLHLGLRSNASNGITDQQLNSQSSSYFDKYSSIFSNEKYKNRNINSQISENNVNAVLCLYPGSKCDSNLLMDSKRVLMLADQPCYSYNCKLSSLTNFVEQIVQIKKKKLNKNNFIGTLNRYSSELIRYYTGEHDIDLLSGSFTLLQDDSKYDPTEKEILVLGDRKPSFLNDIKFKFSFANEKYSQFTIENLKKHPAIIVFPSSVFSFETSLIYALDIPVFVPSPRYYHSIGQTGPNSTRGGCQSLTPKNMRKDASTYFTYNPNGDSIEDKMFWIQFSQFYEGQYIQRFDNGADLEQQINNIDLVTIHKRMKKENKINKAEVLNKWCNLLSKLAFNEKQSS